MSIFDLVREHRQQMAERNYAALQIMLRALNDALPEVRRRLAALERRIDELAARGISPVPARLAQLSEMAELEREIIELGRRLSTGAVMMGSGDMLRAAAAAGAEDAAQMGVSIGARLGYWNPEAVQAVAAALAAESPLALLLERIGPAAAAAARQELTKGVVLGQNPYQTAGQMKRAVGEAERAIGAISEQRARVIARTETNRAYRQASARVYAEWPGVFHGWRWTAARSLRTCPLCLAMDGEVFPAGSVMQSHPSCRCWQVPIVIGDERRSYQRPASEWLAEQSDNHLAKLIGPQRLAMLRDGRANLKDMVVFSQSEWGLTPRLRTVPSLNRMIADGRAGTRSAGGHGTLEPDGIKRP